MSGAFIGFSDSGGGISVFSDGPRAFRSVASGGMDEPCLAGGVPALVNPDTQQLSGFPGAAERDRKH